MSRSIFRGGHKQNDETYDRFGESHGVCVCQQPTLAQPTRIFCTVFISHFGRHRVYSRNHKQNRKRNRQRKQTATHSLKWSVNLCAAKAVGRNRSVLRAYNSMKLTRTSTALGNILSTDTHCHEQNWWWWWLLLFSLFYFQQDVYIYFFFFFYYYSFCASFWFR